MAPRRRLGRSSSRHPGRWAPPGGLGSEAVPSRLPAQAHASAPLRPDRDSRRLHRDADGRTRSRRRRPGPAGSLRLRRALSDSPGTRAQWRPCQVTRPGRRPGAARPRGAGSWAAGTRTRRVRASQAADPGPPGPRSAWQRPRQAQSRPSLTVQNML
jgi:hypothetical protein